MRYDLLAREALRGVVRMALERAASPDGLPGDHHVYLTFRTTAPGVQLPDRLHERYPEDMTIVLKSHFWDLDVGEEGFSVSLSFDQVPERLTIPGLSLMRRRPRSSRIPDRRRMTTSPRRAATLSASTPFANAESQPSILPA